MGHFCSRVHTICSYYDQYFEGYLLGFSVSEPVEQTACQFKDAWEPGHVTRPEQKFMSGLTQRASLNKVKDDYINPE